MLQLLVHEQYEACFYEDQPGTAALSDSAHENEQSPTEERPNSAPTPIGVDEDTKKSDNASQELAEVTLQSPEVSSTGPAVQRRPTEPVVQDFVELDPSTPQGPRKLSSCDLSSSNSSADCGNGKLFSMYWLNSLLTLDIFRQ